MRLGVHVARKKKTTRGVKCGESISGAKWLPGAIKRQRPLKCFRKESDDTVALASQ